MNYHNRMMDSEVVSGNQVGSTILKGIFKMKNKIGVVMAF